MNDNHSRREWIYKTRWMGRPVRSAARTFPVIVVTGARQVGKSTFIQNEFKDFKYTSLDDFSTLQQANSDPSSLWQDARKIIIDEAQRAPGLFNAVKLAVDKSSRRMRFILSGSSNLLLMKNITETLAGRAVYYEMLPITCGEMEGRKDTLQNFLKLWKPKYNAEKSSPQSVDPQPFMLKGFMPPLMHLHSRKDILLWWESYIKTYLERDLRELSQIESLIDFRKVLESLSFRTADVLNQTQIASDTGISQPTVHRYIKLLEVSNIVHRVPAYYSSRRKRVLKSPKIFFVDPALSIYLSGYYDKASLTNSRELGKYFETMMYLHLKVLCELMVPKANIFYWRTTYGKEVDFVLEQGRKLLAFEIKLTAKPVFHDIKNLLTFIEAHPRTVRGILVHGGSSVQYLHTKVLAIPWWRLVS